ncbi:nodulin-related protein 1 [Perilla frutescens var. frutescens]|nr:nodulin-related protein 1 [Perilla frutescens var. frutescens]
MNFLSGFAKSGDSKEKSGEEKSSTTDLFASAKVVAEAAQAQFGNEPEKCDKGKAAGAAADLLDAASDYGKLDETKGFGKYVDQAEGYLRSYNTSSAPAPAGEKAAPPTEVPSGGGAGDYIKKAEEFVEKSSEGGAGDYAKKAEEFLSKPAEGGGEAAGGAGDYIKKAEEFLSKPSDGGEKGESEGGYGGLMKAAGGFLSK